MTDDTENSEPSDLAAARASVAAGASKGLSPGVLGSIAAGIGIAAGLFEPLRHFVINAVIIAGLIFAGPPLYKMVTQSSFVIKDISVPSSLSSRGFTGDVVAQQILDHIAEIDRDAGSKAEKAEVSGLDVERALPQINLPVGGLNLAAVISELRQIAGTSDTKVTGEIFIADRGDEGKGVPAQYGLRLRIAGVGPIYRSDQPSADIAPLIEAAAHEIMHRYDPVNLGYYYYRTRDLNRASILADEVLADPNSPHAPWAYAMRGLIDRDQGHMTDAAMNLREAIARSPNFWLGYVHLAGLLRLDHKLEDAETAARKAIELAPTQQEGHAALALILLDQGHEQAALDEMKKGVDVDPKDPGGHLELGRLQARLKRFEEALGSFKTAAALKPAAEPLLRAADSSRSLKREGEALSYLLQATRSEPKNAEAWLQLGELRLKRNEINRATDALKKAVALDGGSQLIALRAARIWGEARHFTEAGALFTQNAARWGNEPDFLLGWGELLWSEGKRPEAVAKVHEAYETSPTSPQVYVNAGRIFEAHGATADAIDAYRRAVALDPAMANILKPQIDKLAALPPEKPAATPAQTTPQVQRSAAVPPEKTAAPAAPATAAATASSAAPPALPAAIVSAPARPPAPQPAARPPVHAAVPQ